jgi:hypothetical protein
MQDFMRQVHIFPCNPDVLQSESYASSAVPEVALQENDEIYKLKKESDV